MSAKDDRRNSFIGKIPRELYLKYSSRGIFVDEKFFERFYLSEDIVLGKNE